MHQKIMAMLQEINPYVDIDMETQLLEEEILDSMELLLLVTQLEETYHIEISLETIRADDFETIDRIVSFTKKVISEQEKQGH